jgi:hypothetical protein
MKPIAVLFTAGAQPYRLFLSTPPEKTDSISEPVSMSCVDAHHVISQSLARQAIAAIVSLAILRRQA